MLEDTDSFRVCCYSGVIDEAKFYVKDGTSWRTEDTEGQRIVSHM